MKTGILKTVLAVTEMLVGFISAAIGFYVLLDLSNCNPNADLCVPLGMMVVLLLLFPGCIIAIAGAVSYSSKRFPLWLVQSTMIGILVLYFVSLLVLALIQ